MASLYAAAARRRRRHFATHPDLRRRLSRPVLSIGNIAAGGRAKTPLAAYVAARLRDLGERPAILSRGYGRRDAADGVVVVRDPNGIRADLDRAGDEPLMLARQLEGVSVLVCPDRYLAGRLAEHHLDTTVHVLDDGFQHFPLHRDADIVVVGEADLPSEASQPRTLPSGRLREPVDALAAADALICLECRERMADGGRPTWHARRRQQGAPIAHPVVAVAGIAEPSGFFRDLRAAGWTIAREMRYRDHHRYSAADLEDIAAAARAAGAPAIVTTEKDFVRLLPFRPFAVPVSYVPLTLELDDAAGFDAWLRTRLSAARSTP
ncbi:MAG TPA: tetraacyldisaccharide 4'-kinase [Vicinamibacterales bacterium]|nr:tetraacyldisaccharide 4'-kinase [Vicinamibacterales bacterium]